MTPQGIDMHLTFAAVGALVTAIGVIVSIVQTIRYGHEKNRRKELERAKKVGIWSNISIILQTYDTLEDARNMCSSPQIHRKLLLAKINSARRYVVIQYLQLLKEAVLAEPEFTLETVEEWRQLGRLENEWRVAQAKKLVDTKQTSK